MKILMEQIGGYGVIVSGIRGRLKFMVADGIQSMHPLNTIKPVAATMWKL